MSASRGSSEGPLGNATLRQIGAWALALLVALVMGGLPLALFFAYKISS